MNWTKEKPKESGYYWVKPPIEGKNSEIVFISENGSIALCGSEYPYYLKNFDDREWYGPLESPTL